MKKVLALAISMLAAGLVWAQDQPTDQNSNPPAGTPDSTTQPAGDAQTAPAAEGSSQATPDNSAAVSQQPGATQEQGSQTATVPTIPVPEEKDATALAGGGTELDEVTVTAQKYKQSAKNVPISMSVLSDEFVAKRGIVDIVQAMQYVPNVKVASAGFFAAPQARGFSFNNLNLAFESPLGIAFDGIPYQSTTYFNSGLFDIDRVEVLRGPQGTTFGKNTTAGLVQVVSADPTPNFSGLISTQAGQFGRKRAEGAFSGPLIEDIADFRVAFLKDERQGFVRNTTADLNSAASPELGGFTHDGLRGKLSFPNIFGSELKVSYEAADLDSLGTGAELWHVTPSVADVFRKYDPNVQLNKGHDVNSEDFADNRLAKTKTSVAEWTRSFGNWDVTLLGGRSVLSETFQFDVDFSPSPAITAQLVDSFPTTTFEARTRARDPLDGLFGLKQLFGMDLGHTEFLGGFFYQHADIKGSALLFDINLDPYLELYAASQADSGGGGPGGAPLGLTSVPGGPPGSHHIFTQGFDQTDTVMAAFQQADWKFLPRWAMQFGLRVSQEKKTGIWDLFFNSGSPDPTLASLGISEFKDQRSLSETQYLPKVVLSYAATDKINLFAHWARGFKGGGFNEFAYRDIDDELLFAPETTTELGFDIKSDYLWGVLRPNLSIYRMDAKNFQVLGRVKPPGVIGLGTTKVFNAPKAYAQGVEGDITWMPFNGANVLATIGYNQTKYVSFPNNECSADNSATYCDASGKPFAFAPVWDSGLTPSYTFELPFWGLSMTPSVTAQYLSRQLLDTDLDDRKWQSGFVRYNANIAIANLSKGWSFSIIGNNLTNRKTFIRYGDLIPNTFIAVPEQPRTLFGQFRWTF